MAYQDNEKLSHFEKITTKYDLTVFKSQNELF